MKRRIIIIGHYLEIGGAETSLIGLLNALDYEKVEVDLFLYRHSGELMDKIPTHVNLLPEIPQYSFIENSIKETFISGQILIGLTRLWAKLLFNIYKTKVKNSSIDPYYGYLERALRFVLPSLKKYGNYDLALNFIGMPCVVLEKINAEVKVTWIHTDYGRISVNKKLEGPRWLKFDKIVSISKDVTRTFIQVFPDTVSKIVEIENILSPQLIKHRAAEFNVGNEILLKKGCINILSIGRFCEAKRFEAIPKMLNIIKQNGINVHWYIIGYGDDSKIIEQCNVYNVNNMMTILGKKSNPYPYIKACDIYIQPSIYEGKSVTVREAQILCKPVAITNYATAKSQIIDGVDGVILPIDIEGCANGIVDFINNVQLRESIVEYLKTHDYGNELEVNKIYDLFMK